MTCVETSPGGSRLPEGGAKPPPSERRTAVCFIGWGAIGRRVSELLEARAAPVDVVAVAVRDASGSRANLPAGARLISHPRELAATGATLVVEAAGRASVLPWGRAALRTGADLAVSSTSAFGEDGVLDDLRSVARETGGRILIPPGALAGIDMLAAASRLALRAVTHRIIKPPRAWAGTRADELCDLSNLTGPATFFEDTARSAARVFPQNANAAVVAALAGIGLDRTRVALVADPGTTHNVHEIHAEGDFGRLDVRVESRPLANNPRSSETTALNLVRLIENRASALAI